MKEKITKAEFINTWASEWDEITGWKVSEKYHNQLSEQLETLINQEVEKRIVETVAMYGWICPRCGAVHSPFDLRCDCPPPVRVWMGASSDCIVHSFDMNGVCMICGYKNFTLASEGGEG